MVVAGLFGLVAVGHVLTFVLLMGSAVGSYMFPEPTTNLDHAVALYHGNGEFLARTVVPRSSISIAGRRSKLSSPFDIVKKSKKRNTCPKKAATNGTNGTKSKPMSTAVALRDVGELRTEFVRLWVRKLILANLERQKREKNAKKIKGSHKYRSYKNFNLTHLTYQNSSIKTGGLKKEVYHRDLSCQVGICFPEMDLEREETLFQFRTTTESKSLINLSPSNVEKNLMRYRTERASSVLSDVLTRKFVDTVSRPTPRQFRKDIKKLKKTQKKNRKMLKKLSV